MSRIVFRNFTGGEVTSTLSARYDLQKFGTFLQVCENFIPNIHGDIERRPGTEYVATIEQDSYLLPFQFSSESMENYVLVFDKWKVHVYGNNSCCLEYSINCQPYATEHFSEISYSQVGDVIYLAHKCYPLHKLYRTLIVDDNNNDAQDATSCYCWALSAVQFNQSLTAPSGICVCAVSGCSTYASCYCTACLYYKVSSVDEDGIESTGSNSAGVLFRYPTDWYQGDYVCICWNSVEGACEYNIYRDFGGYFGFIGSSTCQCFIDENYEPDVTITPKEDWEPFVAGNHPASVAIHQQRLAIGGTKNSPSSFYMSRTGDFESFRKSYPLQDDDPIEYMVSSNSVDDIHWMASFGNLFIGTSGAEYTADSTSSAITPYDVNIAVQSYWGSKALPPLIIGSSILHEQRYGSHIREIAYNWEIDGYAGNDLSLLAPDLVEGYNIIQWAYQQSPGSNIWMVRNDGVLLCLTYMREQNIYAWSRHITKGEVKSIIVLCGDTEDILWLIVKRVINGEEKWFLERLGTRLSESDDVTDGFYMDCAINAKFIEGDYKISGISHLDNERITVLNNGTIEEDILVVSGESELKYPAFKKVIAGLPYTSVLATMPIETDVNTGSTLGANRAYGNAIIRVYRTLGGSYAATKHEALYNKDMWANAIFYDLPFLPNIWNEPCSLFSGDLQITIPSGQDIDTSIIIKQDKPFPFRLVAISVDVDFGETR